jgi:predicted PurR-regulated permease PerM
VFQGHQDPTEIKRNPCILQCLVPAKPHLERLREFRPMRGERGFGESALRANRMSHRPDHCTLHARAPADAIARASGSHSGEARQPTTRRSAGRKAQGLLKDELMPALPDSLPHTEGKLPAETVPDRATKPSASRSVAGPGLLVLAIIAALYFGRDYFLPVVLAVIVALMLRPIVRAMCRLWIPESVGAALVVLSLLGLGIFGSVSLYGPAMDWVRRAPSTLRDMGFKLRQLQQRMQDFSRAAEEVERLTRTDEKDVPAVQIQDEDWQTFIARHTAGTLSRAVVALVLLFFLLATRARLLRKSMELLVAPAERTTRASLVTETEQQVSRYLFTITVINAGLGVAVGATMWAWGMPNPLLWGVLAAVLNYVPYLGAVVGVVVTLLVAAVSVDDLRWVAVPVSYFVLTSAEGTLITPVILGRRFALDPVVVFLWLAFWGWLWGVGGALLAMPMLVVLRIVSERAPGMRTVAQLLSNEEMARRTRRAATRS